MRHGHRVPIMIAALCTTTAIFAVNANADEWWAVNGGRTEATFHAGALEELDVYVSAVEESGYDQPIEAIRLSIEVDSTLVLSATRGRANHFVSGEIRHRGGILIHSRTGQALLDGFRIAPVAPQSTSLAIFAEVAGRDFAVLEIRAIKAAFDQIGSLLMIETGELTITAELAAALGNPALEGVEVGQFVSEANITWVGGDKPARVGRTGNGGDQGEGDGNGFDSRGGNQGTDCWNPGEPDIGPDVIVGDIMDVSNYAAVGNIEAFALGTYSCNIGSQNLLWIAGNNQHPVIGQNMFRLKNGRFEQIGMSWLKHGFTALADNICGCGCQNPGTGTLLGIGCADPYCCGLNGQQTRLGPRFEVNAHTGVYPYPFTQGDQGASGNSIYKRLQVRISDLDPAQDGGGQYFGETQYVTQDDSAWGNQDNNASYRPLTISGGGTNWSASLAGTTQREKPAIMAWSDNDPTVLLTPVRVPSEGLVFVAAKVTDLGTGFWHYEYAVENLNSHRSIGSFSIPVNPNATVQNIGFHDVDYHSGDGIGVQNIDGTDWPGVFANGFVTWETTPFSTSQNANAIRWGTLYNFRFDCNLPPAASSTVTLGLWRPGTPGSVEAETLGPPAAEIDCNSNGTDDPVDISNGVVQDCNTNSVPDVCETFSPTPLTTVRIMTGLSSPLYVCAAPGDATRLFVVQQGGLIRIYQFSTQSVLPTPFLDLTGLTVAGGERGLLGMAFDPNYNANGYFYVNYTNLSGHTVIARYTRSGGNPNVADPGSALVLKTINQDFSNHNGGCLQFGPDGMLYVGMGDGGSSNDPFNRAQDPGTLLGKMLRLDVNNPPDYIPADNPFVGAGNPLDEIWALGLRNPWRFSFDRLAGDLYIADVGQGAREEINFEAVGSAGGLNYGWDCKEGTICSPGNNGGYGCACADPLLVDPILDYTHAAGACSIIGGYVYRGCTMPDLSGTYFYADLCADFIRSFRYAGDGLVTDQQDRTAELTPTTGPITSIASFGQDANGELYIVSLAGHVYKIIPNTAPPPPECGNGVVEQGEECDPPGPNCDCECQIAACDLTLFEDTFESDQGWTVQNIGLADGAWERATPVAGAQQWAPTQDSNDPGTQCFLTANRTGNSDVDGGPTLLISPTIDMSASGTYTLQYSYWFARDDNEGNDRLYVEISNDGGNSWLLAATHNVTQFNWRFGTVRINDLMTPTAGMKVRFGAIDSPNNSILECGVDNVIVCLGEGLRDCNTNCADDGDDISGGASADCNYDGTPDECEFSLKPFVVDLSPPLAIPDNDAAGVSSAFDAFDPGTIIDVDVGVNITHTFNGDLLVTLRHNNTTVTLIDRPGYTGSGFGFDNDGFDVILDDEGTGGPIEGVNVPAGVVSPPSYVPNTPLAAFDGQEKFGTWTLRVTDLAGNDTGTLNSWSLHVINQGAGLGEICPPVNDNCANALPVAEGTLAFDSTNATTDGPTENNAACNKNGYQQIDGDLWYCYTPACSGTATVSLCGSNFDTKLAVYDACGCPSADTAVACSDDECGLQSEVSLAVVANQTYLIRVGGYQGAAGLGQLTVSCVPDQTCSGPADGDYDGNGQADGDDMQAFINAVVAGSQALADVCPFDFSGNGQVDAADVNGMVNVLLGV